MNINFWNMAVKIVGSDIPVQYEFIYAFVCMLLIIVCIIVLFSPIILFIKMGER